jgi:hypothetical protein
MRRMKEFKIASLGKQTTIILWKNALLMSKNILGTVCELLLSLLFVVILYFIAYYNIPNLQPDEYNERQYFMSKFNASKDKQVFYYPNNEFVGELIADAYKVLKAHQPTLNIQLVGKNFSSAYDLSKEEKKALVAMISFPQAYTSVETIPDSVEYKIYPKEYELILN